MSLYHCAQGRWSFIELFLARIMCPGRFVGIHINSSSDNSSLSANWNAANAEIVLFSRNGKRRLEENRTDEMKSWADFELKKHKLKWFPLFKGSNKIKLNSGKVEVFMWNKWFQQKDSKTQSKQTHITNRQSKLKELLF